MQSCWRSPSEEHEPRYSVEAVRKATRIAAQLERHRSETLSVAEIESLARDLEIDPGCMRRALEAVDPEPSVSPAILSEFGKASVSPSKHGNPRELAALETQAKPTLGERLRWGFAAAVAGLLLPAVWLGTSPRRVVYASPGVPVTAPMIGDAAAGVAEGSVLLNGDFSAGPKTDAVLPLASEALRGWQIMQGTVRYLPYAPGATGGSLCLRDGGAVRQLFRTQPYASYRLTLDLSGTQQSHAALHRLVVAVVNGSAASAVHFTEAKGQAPPGWTRFALEFDAKEPGTTVEIRVADEIDGEGGAPIIDNVAVVPVVHD